MTGKKPSPPTPNPTWGTTAGVAVTSSELAVLASTLVVEAARWGVPPPRAGPSCDTRGLRPPEAEDRAGQIPPRLAALGNRGFEEHARAKILLLD
jgi:hypothetical protein